ncbi:UPF0481 protein At3g47200-like [Aristolochia californica]|uniref:UPF0481 protein At3g47200-like n=1 Tax=Aristolochia californica TaxID=171875 RepID=UPI0035E1C2CE
MEPLRLGNQTKISVETADHLPKRYIHVMQKDKQIAEPPKEDTIIDMDLLKELKEQIDEPAKEDTIVDMDLLKELELMSKEEEAKEWEKCCIYRVPWYVRQRNPQAYTPQLVSFGPYHHGAPHLMEMELHKHRALAHVLRRSGKSFEYYVKVLEPLTKLLMESYRNLDEKWKDPHKFLQLMVLDGFFWLEMRRVYVNKYKKFESDYCENDPIFSSSAAPFAVTDLDDDMAMLENQLPGSLIRRLEQTMQSGEVQEKQVPGSSTRTNSLASKETTQPTEEQEKQDGIEQGPLHSLDELRNSIVGPHRQSTRRLSKMFYSASELHNVGVVFKKKDIKNLRLANLDITFDKDKGILSLPLVHVRMSAESRMLNMVAFEHLHPGKGHEISAYIEFIGFLLQTPRDVRLLQSQRLMFSDHPNAEKIPEYLQKLRHEMRYTSKTSYEELRVDMKEYYEKNIKKWNKRLREWKVNLIKKYFTSPWSFMSLGAAIFLLALSALSTNYTVRNYYKS